MENHDAFGFELRVGESMNGIPAEKAVSDIRCDHGGAFPNPSRGQTRRFAYRCALSNQGGQRRLFLAVECEKLPASRPLVVCGIKRPEREAFDNLVRSHAKGGPGLGGRVADIVVRPGAVSFYPPGVFVGKSLLRLNLDEDPPGSLEDSAVRDAWSRALDSAAELVEKACRVEVPVAPQFVYSAILPIVVVPDGALWLASYGGDGKLSAPPAQAEACEYFVGKEIEASGLLGRKFALSHVHFFTLGGFGAFFQKLACDAQAWTLLFRY